MRRPGKKNFSDLIQENRQALLRDTKAMERIEERLDEKHMKRA